MYVLPLGKQASNASSQIYHEDRSLVYRLTLLVHCILWDHAIIRCYIHIRRGGIFIGIVRAFQASRNWDRFLFGLGYPLTFASIPVVFSYSSVADPFQASLLYNIQHLLAFSIYPLHLCRRLRVYKRACIGISCGFISCFMGCFLHPIF